MNNIDGIELFTNLYEKGIIDFIIKKLLKYYH